jgi:hypothetical protein
MRPRQQCTISLTLPIEFSVRVEERQRGLVGLVYLAVEPRDLEVVRR